MITFLTFSVIGVLRRVKLSTKCITGLLGAVIKGNIPKLKSIETETNLQFLP
jgi:hypothetical protein